MNSPGPYTVGNCIPASGTPSRTTTLTNFGVPLSNVAIGAPGSYHPPRVSLTEPFPQIYELQPGSGGTLLDKRWPIEAWTGRYFLVDGTAKICPASFMLTRPYNAFHFQVWLATESQGANSNDHGWISELPEVGPRLAFTNHKSRDAFEAWWRRYRSFYDADEAMEELPKLPEFETLSITPLLRHGMSRESLIERWAWITENSDGGRVWFTEDTILFEDHNHAVAYRLRWMGA